MTAEVCAGTGPAVILDMEALGRLVINLRADGFRVIAPCLEDGVIRLASIESADALAFGWDSDQHPGQVRLRPSGDRRLVGAGPPATPWKAHLYPARERLWRGRRAAHGVSADGDSESEPSEASPLVLFGVRACDLEGLAALDGVLGRVPAADPGYVRRRREALVIAVNCTRPAATCFCVSMGTGPRAMGATDISLTDLTMGTDFRLLATPGSHRGEALLNRLDAVPATSADHEAAEARITDATQAMRRQMVARVEARLRSSLEHPHWDAVGDRCLACGNCSLVCPTCFCSTIEDRTDLGGDTAERWRTWDSCFTLSFSFVHGGSIRQSRGARYRQWLMHKLSFWWDQFGRSGCVGCGRCIAWCPVGIDLTEEAAVLCASAGRR